MYQSPIEIRVIMIAVFLVLAVLATMAAGLIMISINKDMTKGEIIAIFTISGVISMCALLSWYSMFAVMVSPVITR